MADDEICEMCVGPLEPPIHTREDGSRICQLCHEGLPKKSNDRALDTGWSVAKGMFENPGGFGADECNLCGEKGGEENPLYESKQGNSYCKGCYSQRGRIE